MDNIARWISIGSGQRAWIIAGKLVSIIVVVVVALGWLGSLRVYAETVISVNETADELQQDGDCSLREAIQSVNTNIQFDNCGPGVHNNVLPPGPYILSLNVGTYMLSRVGSGEDDNSTGDLDIRATAVTIQGAGVGLTRLNGGGLDRVLDIDPTDAAVIEVTLTDLLLDNGLAPAGSDGGGILNQGDDTLHIRNSVIDNNAVSAGLEGQTGRGGAIFNQGGTLHITNTFISNNRLDNGSGGGIYNFLGGTVTIHSSVITGNQVAVINGVSIGGGVVNSLSDGMFIFNSTVANNTSDTVAGGISNLSAAMDIANSTISGNQANDNAGGISSTGALSMTHVTIANNTADADGDGVGNGGGVATTVSATVVLKASIITNNHDNSPGTSHPDGSGSFVSAGYNMIGNSSGVSGISHLVNNDRVGVDPQLGGLTGSPDYHPLLVTSPALDQIPVGGCTYIASPGNPLFSHGFPVTSAQNSTRPINGACDIGAYEGPIRVFMPVMMRQD